MTTATDTRIAIDADCWFINREQQRQQGIVAGHLSWRGESLIVIDIGEEDWDFVVRPADLVAATPDAPLGFSDVNEDLHAALADLVLNTRYAA